MRALTPRSAALLALAPLLLAGAAPIAVRALLGFQFPVPWPDEASFLSPAYQLAHTGSLFDPGMNPDRTVMWMPPGYMVLLAVLFRVFGYGFAFARWLSCAFVLASLCLAAAAAWRLAAGTRRIAAAWIVAAAFLSPYVLIDANIARMDVLLACLMLAALHAGLSGRFYVMAALVGGAATVHFNAIYFVPAVAADFLARIATRRLAWPGRGGWAALLLATAALAAYAVHVALNWPGFLADMGAQFAGKALTARLDRSHPAAFPIAALVLAAARLALARGVDGPALASLFGMGFVLLPYFGHELWYDYGQPLGFALLTLAWLSSGLPRGTISATVIAAAFTLVAAFRLTNHLPELLPTRAMLHRDYLSRAEIDRVRRFIATVPPGTTIDFNWNGLEPFFLADLARAHAHWITLRHDMTETYPLRAADYVVGCDSADAVPLLLRFDASYRRRGADTGCVILPGRAATPAPQAR